MSGHHQLLYEIFSLLEEQGMEQQRKNGHEKKN